MCPAPRTSSRRTEGLDEDEKVDFILAIFSLIPAAAAGAPMLSAGWAAPERFLLDGGGGADPSAGLFLHER